MLPVKSQQPLIGLQAGFKCHFLLCCILAIGENWSTLGQSIHFVLELISCHYETCTVMSPQIIMSCHGDLYVQ